MPLTERLRALAAQLRSPSRLLLICANLLLYCLLLNWAADNIRFGRLMDHVREIPPSAIVAALAIDLVVLLLYGTRMQLLIGTDFRTSFSIVNIGYALNTLIPLRLGDAVKVYLSHRLFGLPLLGVLAGSAVEKFADLLVLLLIGAALSVLVAGSVVGTGVLVPVSALIATVAIGFTVFRISIVRIVKLLPRRGYWRRIALELHGHSGNYQVARIASISCAIWIANILLVFVVFNTFVAAYQIGVVDAVSLLLIIAFAVAIPSAPAGVGLFEAGIVVFLTQKGGVENEAALAAAAVFHMVVTLPPLALAGWLVSVQRARARRAAIAEVPAAEAFPGRQSH